jgi:hypothetical protein
MNSALAGDWSHPDAMPLDASIRDPAQGNLGEVSRSGGPSPIAAAIARNQDCSTPK